VFQQHARTKKLNYSLCSCQSQHVSVQTKELIMEGSLGSNSDGLFNKVLLTSIGDVSSFAQRVFLQSKIYELLKV